MTPSHPATRADLFAFFDTLGIDTTTTEHTPVFTVEEAKAIRAQLPGGHCKSLFLKGKKGGLCLLVALEDSEIRLNALAKYLNQGRFSFGKADIMMDLLGVTPGSVTPFGLINDKEQKLTVLLDHNMMAEDVLHYHPLKNDATTAIAPSDLLRFITACGHQAEILDLQRFDQDTPAAPHT